GCGNACTPTGSTYCDTGTCKPNPCPSGFMDCDGNPTTVCETNVQTSNAHCGFCNNPCAPVNATGACQAGVCKITSCHAHFGNCDSLDATGCEIDLTSSTGNCGSCNAACSLFNVATPNCTGGVCAPICAAGFGICNPAPGSSDDGCETGTATSTSNCGG